MNKTHIGFTSAFTLLISFNVNAGITLDEAAELMRNLGKCSEWTKVIDGANAEDPYRAKSFSLIYGWSAYGDSFDRAHIAQSFAYSAGWVAGMTSGMDLRPSEARDFAETALETNNCPAFLDADYMVGS